MADAVRVRVAWLNCTGGHRLFGCGNLEGAATDAHLEFMLMLGYLSALRVGAFRPICELCLKPAAQEATFETREGLSELAVNEALQAEQDSIRRAAAAARARN